VVSSVSVQQARVKDNGITYYVDSGHADADDENIGTSPDLPLVTIQAAVDRYVASALSSCVIDVAPGVYEDGVYIKGVSSLGVEDLIIRGDDRAIVGYPFMHGATLSNTYNRGAGTCSLSSSGGGGSNIVITVTGSTTNPDFDTAGVVAGDTVLVQVGATITEYTVHSVSSNALTMTSTGTAPTVNTNGCTLIVLPNVRIAPTDTGLTAAVYISGPAVELVGLYVKYGYGTASVMGFSVQNLRFSSCVVYNTNLYGMYVINGSTASVNTSYPSCFLGSNSGAIIDASFAGLRNCYAWGGSSSFRAQGQGYINTASALVSNGYMLAQYGGYIYAVGATNYASTPYSPATSNYFDNDGGSISFSGGVSLSDIFKYSGNPGVVVNDGGLADVDFRVESDTESNMLLVDSSADAAYLGGSTNGVKISKGGLIEFVGTATYFVDEKGYLSGSRLVSPSSKIVMDDVEAAYYYQSNTTPVDYIWLNIQLGHGRKLATAIYPHLHWWQASSTVPNWLIQYRYQLQGGAKTTTWTSKAFVSSAFTWSTGTLNQITSFGGITPPTGDGLSDVLQIKIIRDTTNVTGLFSGVDTAGYNAYVYDFDLHTEYSKLGSDNEYS
jgi:hypothetical protein